MKTNSYLKFIGSVDQLKEQGFVLYTPQHQYWHYERIPEKSKYLRIDLRVNVETMEITATEKTRQTLIKIYDMIKLGLIIKEDFND